jgi:L-amino acid N-acyltransferase YncA
LRADDDRLIDRLIHLYQFKPYRDYRVWSKALQRAILRAEVDRVLAAPDHLAVVSGAGDTAVVALGRALSWDSAFFGVPMGRLDLLLRGPAGAHGTISEALDALLQQARELGLRHLAAKVDIADMQAVAALENAGFRLMDSLVTYYTHPRRQPPTPVREVGRVRPMTAADVDTILAITRDAYRGFLGRFYLDPHLPAARSDQFYLEWARQCCAGRMADRIVVADDGAGSIHGWASTRRVEPASTVGGVTLWAGSLGACRRDRPGAYAGLIRSLAMENFEAGEVTETQTQNHNIATVRIYDAVGARYVRGDYTFHAWLG